MRMIQITEGKKAKLAECTEKILHLAGKMMQCVEGLEDPDDYGERSRYGMGMRQKDDEDGYGERSDYGERRRRYMY